MKTKNSGVYLEILNDYLDGKGIDFARYNMNKSDIADMMRFYSRILRLETFNEIALWTIMFLTKNS